MACVISADVNQGVYVKGLFAMFKDLKLAVVSLVFTKTGISIVEKNTVKDKLPLLVSATLGGPNMTYHCTLPEPEFVFDLDVRETASMLAACAKSDAMKLYVLDNDRSQLNLQFQSSKTSASHENLHVIKAKQRAERRVYAIPKYTTERSAAGTLSEFSTIFQGLNKSHAASVAVTFTPEHVVIKRESNNQGSVSVYTFGMLTSEVPDGLSFILDNHAIGVLHKFSGLSDKKYNVSITAEANKPLWVNCSLGNFGTVSLYCFQAQ